MEKIPPELFNAVYLIFDDCVKWNEFIHKQNEDRQMLDRNVDILRRMNTLFWEDEEERKAEQDSAVQDDSAQGSSSQGKAGTYDPRNDPMNQPSTSAYSATEQVRYALHVREESIMKEMTQLAEQGIKGKGATKRRQRFYELQIELNQIRKHLYE